MAKVEVFILKITIPSQYLSSQCDVEIRQIHMNGLLSNKSSKSRTSLRSDEGFAEESHYTDLTVSDHEEASFDAIVCPL